MEQRLILNKLLDKFEKSKHISSPTTSKRRVMLRVSKGELPEYEYESTELRDGFNEAARILQREGIVEVEFLRDRPIIVSIVLILKEIDKAYLTAQRKHPAEIAQEHCRMIREALSDVKTPWIVALRDNICQSIDKTFRLPSFCIQETGYAMDFLRMLVEYDNLGGGTVDLHAFSNLCFQNSMRFEQEFQDELLRTALPYHPEMSELSKEEELSHREKLAILGIYVHPESYWLSGRSAIVMQSGKMDLSVMYPFGVALSSSCVDDINSFDLQHISKIVFIENLTNYHEYLRTEISDDELVIYHGRYSSPKKSLLFVKISKSASPNVAAFFWGDIDLGGFRMFNRLQKVFPQLSPMRMSASDVENYAEQGISRDRTYFNDMESALERHEFPIFEESIKMMLELGITIEQEVFYLLS